MLAKQSSVRRQLSANIERSIDFEEFNQDYFPTKQSLFFVNQVANASLAGGSAFSLQGAYGSGKSSLALFALAQLAVTDRNLPKTLQAGVAVGRLRKQGGLLCVPLVASARPLSTSILTGLQKAAKANKSIRSKALQSCLKLDPNEVENGQLIRLLLSIAGDVKGRGKAGLLLVIDEFGRQLEHIVASKVMADLHLLQALAEMTGTETSPLTLIIIQHHGLEQYSASLLNEQKSEWDKVRGRFREITLNNTETDTAHIIARPLSGRCNINKHLVVKRWSRQIALPALREPDFKAAAKQCVPLHPITIVVLSRLAKLLGQNDRTVVGWLTSSAEAGFAAVAERAAGQWVNPASLFAHFFGDVQMTPSNPVLARRCAVIQSVCDRIGDDPLATMMLHTIALLNFCGGGGLAANEATIKACLPNTIDFEKTIRALEEKSFVIYRKHRQEYLVWEGSDYDLHGKIAETIDHLENDLASALNQRDQTRVLAHAHLIKTGNSRVADLVWLNAGQPVPASTTRVPRILVWLDSMPANATASGVDVCGTVNAQGLAGTMSEIAAMHHLLEHDQNLRADLASQKEMRRLLDFHEQQMAAGVDSLLNAEGEWYAYEISHTHLQNALSAAMCTTYDQAMELHSDLVNRNHVSGQVTSAIRLLIGAMYSHADEELLGIAQFPAERSIYDSLLLKKNVHVQGSDQRWRLTLDNSDNNIAPDLANIIGALAKLLAESNSDRPVDVPTIIGLFEDPPYGLKRMPTLILCVLFLLLNRDRVELYEDENYLPTWGPTTLVRLVRSPVSFAMSTAAPQVASTYVLGQYHKAINNDDSAASPINLVRDLLVRYEGLTAYARQTKTVSKSADAFRRAVYIARSPSDLLFSTVPDALGFSAFPTTNEEVEKYCRTLDYVWAELERVDAELIARFSGVLLKISSCERMAQAQIALVDQASRLTQSDMVYHVHEQFLLAVLKDADGDEWLKGILNNGLGMRTSIGAWNDEEAAHAEFLLRRNLLGLRDAAELLSDCAHEDVRRDGNKMAFAVFWNPLRSEDQKEKKVLDELITLLKEMPNARRLQNIVNLAQHFHSTEEAS